MNLQINHSKQPTMSFYGIPQSYPTISLMNTSRRVSIEGEASATVKSSTSQNLVVIGPYDIICGRCSTAFNNIGNRRFRFTINFNLQRYNDAKSRRDKTEVIMSVVQLLRDDIGARFLKLHGKAWIELGEKQARGKVGHALRDLSVQQLQEDKQTSVQSRMVLQNKSELETTKKKASSKTVAASADTATLAFESFHTVDSLDTIDNIWEFCDDANGDSSMDDFLPIFQPFAPRTA
jgi:hypothetical protein